MNAKLLIHSIMRQTTVLIAQLSTTSGIRSPLAHIADEVFLSLANEIEAQGVSRKVVADMFGLALRSYQKKVQRISESASEPNRTLWEAIIAFLNENGSVTRQRIFERFRYDGALEVGSPAVGIWLANLFEQPTCAIDVLDEYKASVAVWSTNVITTCTCAYMHAI